MSEDWWYQKKLKPNSEIIPGEFQNLAAIFFNLKKNHESKLSAKFVSAV